MRDASEARSEATPSDAQRGSEAKRGSEAGVLLIQLGTPASPGVRDVRRYLREFLSDPLVLDLPAPLRWLLVNAVIAPTRGPKSAAMYRTVWLPEGSPLLVHSRALAEALAAALGPGSRVELGMRYGEPTLAAALARLAAARVSRILVLPLFPQEAQSSSGSAIARVRQLAARLPAAPPLHVRGPFYEDAGFIAAQAELAKPVLAAFGADHVLLSYHSVPERHVRRADASGAHCLASATCCDAIGSANAHCYRAQCYATSRALVRELALDPARTSTSFQSRLGRDPWITPATDRVLPELAARGVRRLAIACPSFVADCLETVEEIGVRARAQWSALGGEALALLPCVNGSPRWVRAVAALVQSAQ